VTIPAVQVLETRLRSQRALRKNQFYSNKLALMTDNRRPLFKIKGLCRCGHRPSKGRKLCSRCRYQHLAQKQRRQKILEGKSLCIICGKNKPTKNKKYCETCAVQSKLRHQEWRRKLYDEVLAHYGNKCVCCGESNKAFLTLDHINNDGAAHRRQLKTKGGYRFYRLMKTQGYPPILQVMCYNCNNAKRIYGICPHQQSSNPLQHPPA